MVESVWIKASYLNSSVGLDSDFLVSENVNLLFFVRFKRTKHNQCATCKLESAIAFLLINLQIIDELEILINYSTTEFECSKPFGSDRI